jgi:Domain of Unknown Function (DUF1080)
MRQRVARHTAVAATLLLHFAIPAMAQSDEGWITLLDPDKLNEWNKLGETNWRLEDAAIVADNRTSQAPAFLVTKDSYGNFQLLVEFWASEDANSGVFFRCSNPELITDQNCYEANIFDQREDPTYGTGAIVRHAEVDPMPKAGGKWNTFEITADGRNVTVQLNGETTAELRSGLFTEGPIALQHGAGTVRFRKVAIKPLD